MNKISLSEHFTCRKLLRYSLPSIGNMLVLTSFQVVEKIRPVSPITPAQRKRIRKKLCRPMKAISRLQKGPWSFCL